MLMAEIIRKKRDGSPLEDDEIAHVIGAYTRGEIPDYQMAALLMAIYFRGLDERELAVWAQAMLRSGQVVDLAQVPGPKVDKHSTGGVGDKVSIPLAPLVAACGAKVPMISGRGLGHTGGTLDKLESIPGFRTDLSLNDFVRCVSEVGVAIVGQTDDIVPADKKIYALRDVTATVDSIPLIAASIMSKKLAEGISALVLDVKVGDGAFMKSIEDARCLAKTMVSIGQRNGVKTLAVLSDMSQPLGWAVGNALEIEESIEILKGSGPEDTRILVKTLGAIMLWVSGLVEDEAQGLAKIEDAIRSGAGLEVFKRMVAKQGGNPSIADDPGLLPKARYRKVISASKEGFVQAIKCEQLGIAALRLGAGRRVKTDKVDHAVGFRVLAKIGEYVSVGSPLVEVHYNNESALAEVEATITDCWVIGEAKVAPPALILGRQS